LGREDLVVERGRELFLVRAGRRVRGIFPGIGVLLVAVGVLRLGPFDVALVLARARSLILLGVRVLGLPLPLLGRLVLVLAAVGLLAVAILAVVALALVEVAVGHEIEVAQELAGRAREQVLVFEL